MDAELLADAEEATQKLKINKLIGYGAFARVYSCEFQNAHETQQVALKVLRSKFCADAADPTRSCFVREAQALHAIRNVSIVRCLGMVKLPTGMPGLTEEDGSLGMILQLGTGGTLYDLLIGTAPALYTDVQAVRWVLQLAKALKSLHEGNPQIIHRDVKLENLLLFPEPTSAGTVTAQQASPPSCSTMSVKLTDFGLHQRIADSMPVYLRRRARGDAAGSQHAGSQRYKRESAVTDDSSRYSAGGSGSTGRSHASMTPGSALGPEVAAGIKGGGSVRGVAPAVGQLGLTSDDVFFTLDETGVARSTGSFLSPSSVRAQMLASPTHRQPGRFPSSNPLRAPKSVCNSPLASDYIPRGNSFSGHAMARPLSPGTTAASGSGLLQRSSFSFSGSNAAGAAEGPRSRVSGTAGIVFKSPLRSPLTKSAHGAPLHSASPLRSPRISPGQIPAGSHELASQSGVDAAASMACAAAMAAASANSCPPLRTSASAPMNPRQEHVCSQLDTSARGGSRLRKTTSVQPTDTPSTDPSVLAASQVGVGVHHGLKPPNTPGSPFRSARQHTGHTLDSLQEGHDEGLAALEASLAVQRRTARRQDHSGTAVAQHSGPAAEGDTFVLQVSESHTGIEAAMGGASADADRLLTEEQGPEESKQQEDMGQQDRGVVLDADDVEALQEACVSGDGAEGDRAPVLMRSTSMRSAATGVKLKALAAGTAGSGAGSRRPSFSGAPTPQLTQSLRQGMPQLQLAPFPTLQIISSHDSAMASTAAGNPTSECSVLTRDLYPMSGFTDPSGRGARPSSKPANRALAAIMTPGSARGSNGSLGGSAHGGELGVTERLGSVAALLRDAAAPTFEQEFEAVFVLTGETGSFLTMSPEVLRAQPYSAAADIFSLGAVAWELLARTPLASLTVPFQRARTSAGMPPLQAAPQRPRSLPRDFSNARELAAEVGSGWRPSFPSAIHPSGAAALASLVMACWSGDPVVRPTAAQVVAELARILATMERAGADSAAMGSPAAGSSIAAAAVGVTASLGIAAGGPGAAAKGGSVANSNAGGSSKGASNGGAQCCAVS